MSTEPKTHGAFKERRPRRSTKTKIQIPMFATLDLRTRSGKEAIRVRNELADDLGGWAEITCAQRELCQRAAILSVLLSASEANYLSGLPIDPGEYGSLINVQNRVLTRLGLKRKERKSRTVKFRDVAFEDAGRRVTTQPPRNRTPSARSPSRAYRHAAGIRTYGARGSGIGTAPTTTVTQRGSPSSMRYLARR